jgi:hypothetical protein
MSVESPAPSATPTPSQPPKRRVWANVAAVLFWVGALVCLCTAIALIWHEVQLPCSFSSEIWIRTDKHEWYRPDCIREERFPLATIAFLGTGMFGGLGWFVWRSRFSLRTLTLLVLTIGALATLPEVLRPPDELRTTIHYAYPITATQQIPPPDVKTVLAVFPEKFYRRIGIDPSTVRVLKWERLPPQRPTESSVFLLWIGVDTPTDSAKKWFLSGMLEYAAVDELAKASGQKPFSDQNDILRLAEHFGLSRWCEVQSKLIRVRAEKLYYEEQMHWAQTEVDWAVSRGNKHPLETFVRIAGEVPRLLEYHSTEIAKLEAEADRLLDEPPSP